MKTAEFNFDRYVEITSYSDAIRGTESVAGSMRSMLSPKEFNLLYLRSLDISIPITPERLNEVLPVILSKMELEAKSGIRTFNTVRSLYYCEVDYLLVLDLLKKKGYVPEGNQNSDIVLRRIFNSINAE